MTLPPPVVNLPRTSVRGPADSRGARAVPEETAIALTYNRAAYAVMMASPGDLEDFGLGFSLTEGVITDAAELMSIEVVPNDLGIDVRMELSDAAAARTVDRRRRLAGPAGCGLCGVESLTEALRPLPRVGGNQSMSRRAVGEAVAALAAAQQMNRATSAVHAAGFWRQSGGLAATREDVGRHNALDKLAGALVRAGTPANTGAIVISSRVSVEMVQKTAKIGAPILIAVSAPTALAVRTAESAGMTLVAVARDDGFEIFCGHQRIIGP